MIASERDQTPIEMPPHVAIVILNWNGWRDTVECLDSLGQLDYRSHTLIVVDNGSTDGSVTEIRARHPHTTLIETGRNLGYAGGNNAGIRYALAHKSDFILLLNNDTVCPGGFLHPLVRAMVDRPSAGFAGPVIYYDSDRSKIWSAGALWNPFTNRLALAQQFPPTDPGESSADVESLVGCALMVRATALKKIGLLDEDFFLMHEESDWCARGRRMGYGCILVPESFLWHKVSVSFGGERSPLMEYFDQRNTLYWAQRHLPKSKYLRAALSELRRIAQQLVGTHPAIAWRSPRSIARGLSARWRHMAQALRQPVVRARLAGYAHYLMRRTGDCPPWIRQMSKKSA